MTSASTGTNRPYFFWDYNVSDDEVRRLISDGDAPARAWVISRILQYAKWEDIWRYLTPTQIARDLDRLTFRRPQDRDLWAYAIERWSRHA